MMDILFENTPYWMYPFVHMLRDGSIFIFASKSSQIFDVKKNKVVKTLPKLDGMYRTYPNTGGSVMLPLKSQNDFNPTIMVCGGGGWQGIDSPGERSCGIMDPLAQNPKWTMTSMPQGRCMVEGVLLLDGTILWINGVSTGAQGFGLSDKAVYDALIYRPDTNIWTSAGVSSIARVYHSVALMLLDGTILVGGSNPNEMPIVLADVDEANQYKRFPTEMRLEKWTPPYLRGEKAKHRPTDIVIDHKQLVARKTSFLVSFRSPQIPQQVEVILYHGGFVTHSLHMGHVMINLDIVRIGRKGDQETLSLKMPDLALAPGPYVIYVVVDGVPGIGQFVTVMV